MRAEGVRLSACLTGLEDELPRLVVRAEGERPPEVAVPQIAFRLRRLLQFPTRSDPSGARGCGHAAHLHELSDDADAAEIRRELLGLLTLAESGDDPADVCELLANGLRAVELGGALRSLSDAAGALPDVPILARAHPIIVALALFLAVFFDRLDALAEVLVVFGVIEPFTGTDTDQIESLSNGNTWDLNLGDFDVISNTLAPDANNDCFAHVEGTFDDDQFAEATLTAIDSARFIGVCIRAADDGASNQCYYFYVNDSSRALRRRTAINTTLASDATAPSVSSVYRIEVTGDALSALEDDVEILSATDTTHTSGQPGVYGYNDGTDATIDDWEGADLAGTAYTIVAETGAYLFTGTAMVPAYGTRVAAESGAYSFTGVAMVPAYGRVLTAESAAYLFTGTNTPLLYGTTITAEGGTFIFTGTAADLLAARILAAETGSFLFTGTDTPLTYSGRILAAESGSFIFTGSAVTLILTVFGDAGAFLITGTAATLAAARRISAEAGAIAVTGTEATLTYSGGNPTITAEAGSVLVTGTAAVLALDRILAAATTAYAFTGAEAGLIWSGGNPLISAEGGTFAFTGTAADLEFGRVLIAGSGAILLTGGAAALARGQLIVAAGGAFTVSGSEVTFDRTYVMPAAAGAYLWTGQIATLTYAAVAAAASGKYANEHAEALAALIAAG